MADTTALKNRIRAAVKANDNQEITGPVLQQALLDMVDELNGATETEAIDKLNTAVTEHDTKFDSLSSKYIPEIITIASSRIDSDGKPHSNVSAYVAQEITNFQPGDKVHIKVGNLGPTGAILYSVLDENDNILLLGPSWDTAIDTAFNIPAGAAKFYTMQSISGYRLLEFSTKRLMTPPGEGEGYIKEDYAETVNTDYAADENFEEWMDSQKRLLFALCRNGFAYAPKLKFGTLSETSVTKLIQLLAEAGFDNVEKRPYRVKLAANGDCIVIHKYSSTQDLRITFGKCGTNQLYALKKQEYINNSSSILSDFTDDAETTLVSGTDWVGPYVMTADKNGNGRSGFTGGWHGFNGDQTGAPTARNISYAAYADDRKLIKGGDEVYCNELHIVVVNNIQAGNTKESDGSGREVLQEKVMYHFLNGKIYVSVMMTPFEDIHIQTYYGLQISGFDSNVKIISKNKVMENTTPTTSIFCPYHSSDIVGERNDGKRVVAHLDNNIGLGNGLFSDTTKYAFFQSYGSSGKSYFSLIGDSVALPLGENFYWQGFYAFCKDEIKTN